MALLRDAGSVLNIPMGSFTLSLKKKACGCKYYQFSFGVQALSFEFSLLAAALLAS